MKEYCDGGTGFPHEPVEYAYLVEPLPLRKFWKYLECSGRPQGPPSSKNPNESLPKTTGSQMRASSSPAVPPGLGWVERFSHLFQLCLHLTCIPECYRGASPGNHVIIVCSLEVTENTLVKSERIAMQPRLVPWSSTQHGFPLMLPAQEEPSFRQSSG